MSKKHFIALGDAIRNHPGITPFTYDQVKTLADFCQAQNPAFDRERWMRYVGLLDEYGKVVQ